MTIAAATTAAIAATANATTFTCKASHGLGDQPMNFVQPGSVHDPAVQAPPQTQMLEVGQRLGECEAFLEEHQVPVEQAPSDVHRVDGPPAEDDLHATTQPQLVVRRDGTGALGSLFEGTTMARQSEERVESRHLLERAEELS